METTGLTTMLYEGFSLDPRLEEAGLVVRFSGNADMAAVAPLGLFLKQVHQEAIERAVSRVSFDLKDLYFMNSSCFKAFVTWIATVGESQPPAYEVCFLTNPKQYWQRRSLEALRHLAPRVVRIEALAS